MSKIRQDDLIASVCDALQFMSYYHPKDYIDAVFEAWQREESQAAKDAMAQILVNSKMCAEGKRPLCQDTGIVTVFVKVGMEPATTHPLLFTTKWLVVTRWILKLRPKAADRKTNRKWLC